MGAFKDNIPFKSNHVSCEMDDVKRIWFDGSHFNINSVMHQSYHVSPNPMEHKIHVLWMAVNSVKLLTVHCNTDFTDRRMKINATEVDIMMQNVNVSFNLDWLVTIILNLNA